MDRQDGRCLGDVLNGVAKEVLNPHGREVVGDYVACGEMPMAVEAVAGGIDQKVACREMDREQASVMYVLLGISPTRLNYALGRRWD